jgi:hypothetical protein
MSFGSVRVANDGNATLKRSAGAFRLAAVILCRRF